MDLRDQDLLDFDFLTPTVPEPLSPPSRLERVEGVVLNWSGFAVACALSLLVGLVVSRAIDQSALDGLAEDTRILSGLIVQREDNARLNQPYRPKPGRR